MEKIITYINTCRNKGFSDGYIKSVLKDAGHQDYIINKAMSLSRGYSKRESNNRKMMSVLVVLILLIGIFSVVSLTSFFLKEDPVTGNVVVKEEYDDSLVKANQFLEAKNKVIQQQVDMINNLDLSVEEKNRLIQEQTLKIDQLFEQIQSERSENLDASIELINSLLARE